MVSRTLDMDSATLQHVMTGMGEYCVGRRTYVTGSAQELMTLNHRRMRADTKQRLVGILDERDLGDGICDAPGWTRVRHLLDSTMDEPVENDGLLSFSSRTDLNIMFFSTFRYDIRETRPVEAEQDARMWMRMFDRYRNILLDGCWNAISARDLYESGMIPPALVDRPSNALPPVYEHEWERPEDCPWLQVYRRLTEPHVGR